MNGPEIKAAIEQAIANLFEHQPNIFKFTPQTGQTEWNLAHHLAVELGEFFPDLDCDLDLLKRDYENMRPDIVFHKRDTHESNSLVIELKRDGTPGEIGADIEKIHHHWFQGKLHYQFGSVINLRSDGKHEVQVFENPDKC